MARRTNEKGGIVSVTAFVENWNRLAEHVLAVLLAEEGVHQSSGRYESAVYDVGLKARSFPAGHWRAAFQAIDTLRGEGAPVHRTTVLTQLNGTVDEAWIAQRIALYSPMIDGDVFDRNVRDLIKIGEVANVRQQLRDADMALSNGEDLNTSVVKLMTELVSSGEDSIKNETAIALGDDLVTHMASEPDRLLATGIECLDAWMGGIGVDDVIGLTAPYKMRKSTLARNIALNMAREGASVAILMYESNRRMVAAQFVSMLAIEYLVKNDLYYGKRNNHEFRWISAKDLVVQRKGYKKWYPEKVAAVDYGIAEWRKLENNIRIYDKSKQGGKLVDLASAHRVLLRDKRLYGTDIAIIDHATQIMEPGSVYDRMQKIAPFLETLARQEQFAMCILAQMNEESVKGSRDSHSPGVKGGGDLPAACDYLFTLSYREADADGMRDDSTMTITMHLSRYGTGGSDVKQPIPIDPASGLHLKTTRSFNLNAIGA
jgi:replicative DNA helicase